MTDTAPPLPEPILEGIDYELWGQNAKTDCYSPDQMRKRDAYWQERLRAAEADVLKLNALYVVVGSMMSRLGAEGEITRRDAWCTRVMDALYDIDGGTFDKSRAMGSTTSGEDT